MCLHASNSNRSWTFSQSLSPSHWIKATIPPSKSTSDPSSSRDNSPAHAYRAQFASPLTRPIRTQSVVHRGGNEDPVTSTATAAAAAATAINTTTTTTSSPSTSSPQPPPPTTDSGSYELDRLDPTSQHDKEREARTQAKRDQKRRWLDDLDEMKFSHSIQFNAVPDWSSHYIAYSNLKKL